MTSEITQKWVSVGHGAPWGAEIQINTLKKGQKKGFLRPAGSRRHEGGKFLTGPSADQGAPEGQMEGRKASKEEEESGS